MKKHELVKLPYGYDALEPILSQETIEFHHNKHHQGYVDQLNKLVVGTSFENSPLETILLKAEGPLLEQAAQVWNHNFYWKSMNPKKVPISKTGLLMSALDCAFGGIAKTQELFEEIGASLFGSGWLWLVSNPQKELQFIVTKNAENPMKGGLTPLFVCDLWEHSYYLEYKNERANYISKIFEIIDWSFAESNYGALLQTHQESNPSPRILSPIALLLFLAVTLTFSFENAHAEESIGDRVANQSGDVSTNTKRALRKGRKKVRDATGNHSTIEDIKDTTNNAGDEISNSAKKIKRKVN